jgi:hypothetical protein
MLALLGLSEDNAQAAGAGALLPGGVARSEKERSASRRAEAGVQPRAVTVSARVADGREALALQATGKTMREIVALFAGRRGETSIRRAMAEAAAETPEETVPETVAVAPVETASEDLGEQSVSAPHGSTATIVAMPGLLPPAGAPTPSDTSSDAIPGRPDAILVLPPTLDPQGDPRMASEAGMSVGSGSLVEGTVAAFPGLRLSRSEPAIQVATRAPFPAFLARLLDAGTCTASAVST